MAEEHAYNTITAKNMELESGYIAETSHSSANQSNDDSMDHVKMEFVTGDEDDLDVLTEETVYHIEEEGADVRNDSDIPDGMTGKTSLTEETTNIFEFDEEDDRHLRLHSGILEGLIAETSVLEISTDSVSGDFRTNCDILECMTVTSSPAEQTIDLLDEVSADLRRNNICLPEENNSEDVYVTRAPTLVIMGASHKFAVGSRYLSAPCASYHDFCKAGHKHYLEDPNRFILGTIKGPRPLMRTTGDAISLSKAETRKKALLRRSSLPSPMIGKDPQTHIENMNHCKVDLNHLKLKHSQGEIKPPAAPTCGHSSSRSKTDIQACKKMVVQSPKLLENSSQPVKEIKTRKEAGSHSRVKKEKTKEPLNDPVSSKMPPTQKKSPSMKTRIHKNLPSFSHSKNQSNSKEAKIKKSVLEKTLHVIEPSTDKKLAKRVLKVPSSSKSLQNTEKAKEPMGSPSSPSSPVTVKRPPSMKARLHKNLKSFSPSKHQNKPEQAKITGTVDVPEKTLYMIEPISDKKPLRKALISASSNKSPKSDKKTPRKASISASFSKQLPNARRTSHIGENKVLKDNKEGTEFDHLSPSSTSESISVVSIAEQPNEPLGENQQDSDSMNIQQISTTTADAPPEPSAARAKSMVNCNRESKMTETCHPDEKDGSSRMVKLRRGTMVSLQSADNSPESLPFRSGGHLDGDENSQDELVCLKKTAWTDDEPCDTKPETAKVLLRHQEVVGKNYNLDLNNVIEETASILVKTRKSKVKALVGAFETVISLHDRKPVVESRVS